jgi:hypothetical protein
VAFQRPKAGRKPSQNKRIAFKRISTDALMVKNLFSLIDAVKMQSRIS